ncbi:MAG: reverse transcriptase domain-containing protein [bacterium]|nr:reverse transcriptase domain-containing protein [bacterium]
MSRIQFKHSYYDIISLYNLLEAWKEFVRGKRKRKDVQEFERNLMANIISLHHDLAQKIYKHRAYEAFRISDPKPRDIHKACVRDRLLHHALHRMLYPFFDRTFISDSSSCRLGKGTHKANERFYSFSNKVTKNHTKTAWVLKCDIRKFFASVDQATLIAILATYIPNKDIITLLAEIIGSFYSTGKGTGLPLGNLTSQLLVNVYMNEFDQFMKHKIKAEYYIRYADDFVIFSSDKILLQNTIPLIGRFLSDKLKLHLHPNKISIRTITSGIDYLGWVHFPDHRVLRTVTKRRMFKRLKTCNGNSEVVSSYLGLMSHGNTKKIKDQIQIEK